MKTLPLIAAIALFATPVLAESSKNMNQDRMRSNNSYPDTTGSTPGMLNEPNSQDQTKGDQRYVPDYQRGTGETGGPARELIPNR
jgi:hypothetical protein